MGGFVRDQPAGPEDPCILVVEDEMLVAMMLEDMLRDIGYRVVMASRVKKGSEIAASAAIDCAILDVNVDGVTSYPVAKELRRRGIPFLFSTGYSAATLRADYRESPMLAKPYSLQSLKHAVETAMATTPSGL
jgi:DNA-binding response OmpR family regulator